MCTSTLPTETISEIGQCTCYSQTAAHNVIHVCEKVKIVLMQVQCEHVPRHLCVLQHLLREAYRTQPTTETNIGCRNRACTASTVVGNTHQTLRLPVRFQDLVPFHIYPIHILPIYTYMLLLCHVFHSCHLLYGCSIQNDANALVEADTDQISHSPYPYVRKWSQLYSCKATLQGHDYCVPHQRQCLYLGNQTAFTLNR